MRTTPQVFIGGFLLGVAIQSVELFDIYTTIALLFGSTTVAFLGFRYSLRGMLYVVLFALASVLGVVRAEFALRNFDDSLLLKPGSTIERTATISEEPDVRETNTIIVIELDKLVDENVNVVIRTRVPQHPEFNYGDRVKVRGTIELPKDFETDTGRIFDYRNFLMKEGIHYELVHSEVTFTGDNSGNIAIRSLLKIKHTWLSSVSLVIPEPSSSLLGGLVVGAKRSLGDMWLNAFRDTGIVHIVVLSGYNLTLVAVFIVWITQSLPRVVRFALGVLGIIAFALMTGASATVVRASIMAALAMFAHFLARPYAIMRALIVAAFLMVLVNPFLLLYDPGFQLSFVATVGLVLGSPLVERHLHFITTKLGLRSIVSATLATQCAVLPLLMYQIGEISLVAPIVNILVLPVVPIVMAIGILVGPLAFIAEALALPFAWITHVILSYIFNVVELFASLPLATLTLPPIPALFLIATYAMLLLFVLSKQKSQKEPSFIQNGFC